MGFIRVAIDVPLPRLFDYRCDDASACDIGLRVMVPFGSKRIVGIIFEIAASSNLAPEKLRTADRILRDMPPLATEWLSLASFCSGYYQRPLGEVIHAALPPRLRSARPLPARDPDVEHRYALEPAGDAGRATLPARSRARLALLERLAAGPATESELALLVRQ